MNKEQLKARVEEYELIARAGKIRRMLHRPFNYLFGIIYREVFYKINRKGKLVTTPTFLNDSVNIVLPACMDIYITGGKSHDSEIRLTKFLVNQLNEGDSFLDVGAHIGFFTLLAAHIVSYTGNVIAVEASPTTFQLLKKNIASHKNIVAINKALSFENGKINFLEFPIIYSEFNTLETSQYENEEWFKKIKPSKIEVDAIKADDLLNERTPPPSVVKIDAEGAEYKVIVGMLNFLKNNNPIIIMEFANEERGNENHKKAEQLLQSLDYFPHKISKEGKAERLTENTSSYLKSIKLESDNIVYCK